MCALPSLLSAIPSCRACDLMEENNSYDIPYVPVVPKPFAKIVFVGRDPSPRTVKSIGLPGGRSVFIKEIFNIIIEAGISDDLIYITDLCKCHWRTSVGRPLLHTENRSTKLHSAIAKICMSQWFNREICIIQPLLIVTFGEELYQLLYTKITTPFPAPKKLSVSVDKSTLDAELWFIDNGPLSINLGKNKYLLAPIRHPGNSSRLPKHQSSNDRRFEYYQLARNHLIDLIRKVNSFA